MAWRILSVSLPLGITFTVGSVVLDWLFGTRTDYGQVLSSATAASATTIWVLKPQ